jgi:hypothetical protein
MVISHRVDRASIIDAGKRILACGGRNASILDADTGRTVYALPQIEEPISAADAESGDPWILQSNGLARYLRTGN